MEYYIYMTNDCNLNCSYCSVLFDTKKNDIPLDIQYSMDDLEHFITNTQISLNDPIADIYFFGGEPTLKYDVIQELMDKMDSKQHFYTINYVLHTNGLLALQAPKNILNKTDIVLLSINYEKIYLHGHITSYFQKIINSVQFIKSIKNCPIIGRITVSPETDLYTECCLLGNFFDYVYWQMDNSEIIDDIQKYQENYKSSIDLLFKYWMSFLAEGAFLNFVPFVSAVHNFINEIKTPEKFYCGYGSSMIYVQTNGNCFACCDRVESKSHFIGDIYFGIDFPATDLQKTICRDCQFIKICGGRCGRMHKDFGPKRISEFCALNQYMFTLIETALPEIKKLIKKYPYYLERINDPLLTYTEYTA